jgi:uncharacterized RDD family membrane protein YckC
MSQIYAVLMDETIFASKGQRFLNYLIDVVIYYLIIYLIGITAVWLYESFGYEGMYNWVVGMSPLGGMAFNLTIMALYYLFMEGITQRTVGKFITGTIVLAEDGSKPEIRTIAIRTLCRYIPFEAFSFFNDSGRGWHDSITKTYVVNAKKYKTALELKNSFDEIGKEQIDTAIAE